MKVAIPHWQGRVSPVLDVASHVLLVDLQAGQPPSRQEADLTQADPLAKARQIVALGADVVVCGAVSWPMEAALGSSGVQVVVHTCGVVEEVLAAFLAGRLGEDTFRMPGCCGRRRLRASRCRGGQWGRRGRPGREPGWPKGLEGGDRDA